MAKHLPRSVLSIGLGGALNVYAGSLPRAPRAVRAVGAEWAYRILLEPRRLQDVPALLSYYMHMPMLLVKQTSATHRARGKLGETNKFDKIRTKVLPPRKKNGIIYSSK